MACCVIAAFILAQCVATVRRWGMYWGVVNVPEGESAATLFGQMRSFLQSRRARAVVLAVVAVECLAFGGWLYVEHGQHIAQLTDVAWSRLHGKEVIYAERCVTGGRTSVRLVLNEP